MNEELSENSTSPTPYRLLLVGEPGEVQQEPWQSLQDQEHWLLQNPQSPAELTEQWSPETDALIFCSSVHWNAWEPVVASLLGKRPSTSILLVSDPDNTPITLTYEGPLQWLDADLSYEVLVQTLLAAIKQTRIRRQQAQLLSHLERQNQQLEFQHKIISALQDLRFESNEPFRVFLEHIGEQLLPLEGLKGIRVRVRSSYLVEEYTLGLKGLDLPWSGAPIPESQVAENPDGLLLSAEELAISYPHLPLQGIRFFGFHLQDSQEKLQGELGIYLKSTAADGWTEELLRLVARKLALFISNKVAALETRRTFDTLMDLASFNMSLLTNFHQQMNQELDHYRRTLDLLLTREDDDLLPTQAVIIRQNDRNDLRATPFHRNDRGRVAVMAPTLDARSLQELFPPTQSGFSYNLTQEEIHQHSSRFPRELTDLFGSIRNYVYCSLHLIQGHTDTLVLFNYGRPVREQDAALLMAFSLPLSFQIGFSRETKNRRRTQIVAMAKLAELAEKRDDETGAHLKRIAHYSRVLAEDLAASYSPYNREIDAEFIREIYESSPLHDIGKVGIADHVLCKPGRLTDEEYEIMKTHTLIGAEVLEGVEFLKMAHDIALCHHEKFDGTGYPRGLSGLDIPLAARIVTLADVYDAITSRRVYRPQPFTHEEAKSLLLREYGRHFDPAVVDAFLRCEQLFVKIREKYNPNE